MFYVASLDYAKELAEKQHKPLIIAESVQDIQNTHFDAIFYVEKSDDRFYKLDKDIVFKEFNEYSVVIRENKKVDDELIKRFKNGEDIEKELKLNKTDTGVELTDFLNTIHVSIPTLESMNCSKKIIYREVRRKWLNALLQKTATTFQKTEE